MSSAQTSTFTDSALSDKVKEFLTRFKDGNGEYKYVQAIDE
ncbi:MCM family protein, partial [Marine Group I thaumarchaeote SCGC AAA799-N04]